jgi:hypothetical protein
MASIANSRASSIFVASCLYIVTTSTFSIKITFHVQSHYTRRRRLYGKFTLKKLISSENYGKWMEVTSFQIRVSLFPSVSHSLPPLPGKLRFPSKPSLLQELIYLDNELSTNFIPRWCFHASAGGDEVEMILNDRANPHFTETTN